MEQIIKWIMDHKKWMLTLIIAVILLPMVIIHLLFKIQSNCYWIESEWEAGEALGYFGDVLSFIGTVVLGYIAIAQTENANQMNRELLKIEKNRIKPCLDVSSMQLYKIYLAEDMTKKLNDLERSNVMIMSLLHTSNPRTGIETSSALIELEVNNSGFSDIRRIFVKKASSYLAVSDPFFSKNEEIAIMGGNTSLKAGESKKLYICINREISCDEELYSNWYKENIDKLMPHMEFEFVLETVTGNSYAEKITCGSSWDISMKNIQDTATRAIGVSKVCVNEIVS